MHASTKPLGGEENPKERCLQLKFNVIAQSDRDDYQF